MLYYITQCVLCIAYLDWQNKLPNKQAPCLGRYPEQVYAPPMIQ